MRQSREVWWLVALEAAVMFSLPTWAITDQGWPGVSVWPFALAVAAGATVARGLFHVLPGWCAGSLFAGTESLVGRAAQAVGRGWFWVAAAAELGMMAAAEAALAKPPKTLPDGRLGGYGSEVVWLALLFGALCLALAWRERWWRTAIAASLGFGAGLLLVSLAAHSGGMGTRNWQMGSEAQLDRPIDVLLWMVWAAAPASVAAVRLGRMGLGMRAVCRLGVWGMWLPLAASVAMLNVSKMWGARLYWKPSLPIQFPYAFVWAYRGQLWVWHLLILTMLVVAVVSAVWIVEMTPGWRWRWRVVIGMAGVGWMAWLKLAGWPVMVDRRWAWWTLAGWVTVGVWQGWVRLRGKERGSPRSAR